MTTLLFAPTSVHTDLQPIPERAETQTGMTFRELTRLMDDPESGGAESLFAAARKQRERYFGNAVFLYGFLYISTHCRNHCRFCFYRNTNEQAVRYRKTHEQIMASARKLAESGVHLLDLTAGEDPRFYRENGFDGILRTVEAVKRETGLPVMASLGVVPQPVLPRLADAGADWYACYQETFNQKLFERLRMKQCFHERLQSKRSAASLGMLVEEGLLCGVGETARDVFHAFKVMEELKADQVRVMTFIPQPGTPMNPYPRPVFRKEMVIIALMRLLFPRLLIPASLDVDGLAGLKQRLDAGANVVTSLVPPGLGLAGVAQSERDIEDGSRTVDGIADTLKACGLAAASGTDFRKWMDARKRMREEAHPKMAEAC